MKALLILISFSLVLSNAWSKNAQMEEPLPPFKQNPKNKHKKSYRKNKPDLEKQRQHEEKKEHESNQPKAKEDQKSIEEQIKDADESDLE